MRKLLLGGVVVVAIVGFLSMRPIAAQRAIVGDDGTSGSGSKPLAVATTIADNVTTDNVPLENGAPNIWRSGGHLAGPPHCGLHTGNISRAAGWSDADAGLFSGISAG